MPRINFAAFNQLLNQAKALAGQQPRGPLNRPSDDVSEVITLTHNPNMPKRPMIDLDNNLFTGIANNLIDIENIAGPSIANPTLPPAHNPEEDGQVRTLIHWMNEEEAKKYKEMLNREWVGPTYEQIKEMEAKIAARGTISEFTECPEPPATKKTPDFKQKELDKKLKHLEMEKEARNRVIECSIPVEPPDCLVTGNLIEGPEFEGQDNLIEGPEFEGQDYLECSLPVEPEVCPPDIAARGTKPEVCPPDIAAKGINKPEECSIPVEPEYTECPEPTKEPEGCPPGDSYLPDPVIRDYAKKIDITKIKKDISDRKPVDNTATIEA